jgi:hypothetical protein
MEGSSIMGWYMRIKLALKLGKAVYDAAEPSVSAAIAMRNAAKVMNAAAEVQEELDKKPDVDEHV